MSVEWPKNTVIDVPSLAELLRMLQNERLDRYKLVWRGVSDITYRLDPGIVRKIGKEKYNGNAAMVTEQDVVDAEKRLLTDARLLGLAERDRGESLDDDNLRARLQHQGAATRLLDVTSNVFIALWMAVHNERKADDDGALFGIDWTVDAEAQRPTTVEEMLSRGESTAWLWEATVDIDPRIRSQAGKFLLGKVPEREDDRKYASIPMSFPNHQLSRLFADVQGGGRYPKSPTIIFRLSPEVKRDARKFLERIVGMSAVTVFPDIAGFAQAHSA